MGKREQILQMVGVLKEEPAKMPGPDGPVDVLLREMTGKEAEEFEQALDKKTPNTLGRLLQTSIYDPETKERLFQPADRAALEELGMTALKPILEKIKKVSAISKADVEKLKANLKTTPTEG